MDTPATLNISFQKIFYLLASAFGIITILIFGKPILFPLGLALLLAFNLFPMVRRMEKWRINRFFASFLAVLVVVSVIGAGVFFFSSQIVDVETSFGSFRERIMDLIAQVIAYLNSFSFIDDLERQEVIAQISEWLNNSSGFLVRKSFSNTTAVLTHLGMTFLFTYLLLIYRKGLVRAFGQFFPKEKRERALAIIPKIQQIGQKYLFGKLLLILFLGVANSIGLWAFGLENPVLFGFLASTLSIIPYVGTVVGAALPVLYAFTTEDSLGIPAGIAIMFWAIQLVESNVLTPQVVGNSVNLNALISIVSLLVGAMVWGIAGMILALPFVAMLRVVFAEYESLKPVAMVMGTDNFEEESDKNSWLARGWRRIKKGFGGRDNHDEKA